MNAPATPQKIEQLEDIFGEENVYWFDFYAGRRDETGSKYLRILQEGVPLYVGFEPPVLKKSHHRNEVIIFPRLNLNLKEDKRVVREKISRADAIKNLNDALKKVFPENIIYVGFSSSEGYSLADEMVSYLKDFI